MMNKIASKIADSILWALPHRMTGHFLQSRKIISEGQGTTIALICLKCPHVEHSVYFPFIEKPPINVNA